MGFFPLAFKQCPVFPVFCTHTHTSLVPIFPSRYSSWFSGPSTAKLGRGAVQLYSCHFPLLLLLTSSWSNQRAMVSTWGLCFSATFISSVHYQPPSKTFHGLGHSYPSWFSFNFHQPCNSKAPGLPLVFLSSYLIYSHGLRQPKKCQPGISSQF